ncbi:MAG TPA: cytochrome c-type biogenesis protein [Caulobacteraceae bacterium]|nr:cytochrome c-type biogenesis protein [Caulobacteraceae bacterium]
MRALARVALAACAWMVLCAAAADDPAERLANPHQEARARALFRDVRCLVCQSESIDQSDAPLANDLRQLIRRRIAAGRTDGQIRAFLVSRYGQFVLLTPRLSAGNAVLWAGPAAVVAGGLAALALRRRSDPQREPAPLSAEEEADLDALTRGEPV